MLCQPKGIECRLVDHRRRGQPLIGLVGGECLPGQRPEQSIHLTRVVAHLLELGLHICDHPVRGLSALTHIGGGIIGIILGRRIVAPRRIPVAAVPVKVTATDQLHARVTRPIPELVMPFRMIRAEYFVLRTLPLIGSLNSIILLEGNRRYLLRLGLCAESRVLLFDLRCLRLDLLHLLRLHLLRRGRRTNRRGCLSRCRGRSSPRCSRCRCRCWRCTHRSRSSRCRSSRCFRRASLHPFLVLRAGRRTGGRLTGNIRLRPSLPAFSCSRLSRRSAGRLTGNICSRLRAGRSFLARSSLSAFSCTRLSRRSTPRLTGNICSRLRSGRSFLARSC